MYAYSGKAVRRLLIALWAHATYTGGSTPGPDTVEIFIEIPIVQISQATITGLLVVWFATRYFEQITKIDRDPLKIFLLVVRGALRGVIISGFVYALFTTRQNLIQKPFDQILWFAFIFEPLIYLMFSSLDKTLSTKEMVLGEARLPLVALRETLLANTVLLYSTKFFKGIVTNDLFLEVFEVDDTSTLGNYFLVSPEMWDYLGGLNILFLMVTIALSIDSVKRFNENPFRGSILGSFIQNAAKEFENIDLNTKMGHVLDNETLIEVSKDNSISLDPGAVLVPIKREKGKVQSIILGKGQNLLKDKGELNSQLIDGITTVMIPARKFKKIEKQYLPKRMDMINFENLELPSLETIEGLVQSLGFQMNGFMEKVKHELLKFDLSNYSITETDQGTKVILPGIKVIEDASGLTSVNVMGIRVMETPDVTSVRIGSWLNVFEVPNFTFVTMPFITVIDVKGIGTAVNLMGFKIGDGIEADRLLEFQNLITEQMKQFELEFDSRLGRIFADKDANAVLSIGWDGQFTPLLESSKHKIGDHPALGAASMESKKLLPGYVPPEESLTPERKMLELTGISSDPAPVRKREKRINPKVEVDIDLKGDLKKIKGIKGVKAVRDIMKSDEEEPAETADPEDEIAKLEAEIERLKSKITKEEESTDDYTIIHDADYEIVDDEE